MVWFYSSWAFISAKPGPGYLPAVAEIDNPRILGQSVSSDRLIFLRLFLGGVKRNSFLEFSSSRLKTLLDMAVIFERWMPRFVKSGLINV